MTDGNLHELRSRIALFRRMNNPPDGWNACLDWVEQQIKEVIDDLPFTLADGPVSRDEFERVVGG
jgi:hypothetical protein